jgi:hypothetical protein
MQRFRHPLQTHVGNPSLNLFSPAINLRDKVLGAALLLFNLRCSKVLPLELKER